MGRMARWIRRNPDHEPDARSVERLWQALTAQDGMTTNPPCQNASRAALGALPGDAARGDGTVTVLRGGSLPERSGASI